MAEKLCKLRKYGGGSGLSETVLWTNPSPTSSFTNQSITTLQAITGFKMLKFTIRASTSDAAEFNCYFSVDEYISQENGSIHSCLPSVTNSNTTYIRNCDYRSGAIYFASCFKVNASGSDQSKIIPIAVYGLK